MSRALTHANLVRGLAYGYDASALRHYLILEYVDGPNALSVLERTGPLSVGAVVRVGTEMARALGYMHAQGFVHRDVKPDNVLLGPNGTVKLGDLGLAKRLTGDLELTTTSQGVGTPHYMPYEQSVNGDLVDGRSDLFALGATLYHLLTGQVPFRGETHEEIVREKAQDAYLPVREFRPDVPPVVDVILSRMLACDPRARFQSASELVKALADTGLAANQTEWVVAAVENGAGEAAHPDEARTRADLPLAMPSETPPPMRPVAPAPSSDAVPPAPKRRFLWSAIGLSFLALAVGLASARAMFLRAPAVCPAGKSATTASGCATGPCGPIAPNSQ
jgi:serine/threonine-protein kinase